MASKIIKQGTARASSIQKVFFSENAAKIPQPNEESLWPDLHTNPTVAPKKALLTAESAKPSVDLAQMEKAAHENGFLQGQKAGMEMAEKRVEAAMKRFADSLLEVGKFRASLYTQVEREVVRLAVEVAKKIVHREIQADPDIIQTLVRVALSHVAEKSAVTIHLSPTDYSYLLEQRSELSQTEGRDISLLADKSIERGGCLIQTECGDVDARVEERFREVEHAFFEGIK